MYLKDVMVFVEDKILKSILKLLIHLEYISNEYDMVSIKIYRVYTYRKFNVFVEKGIYILVSYLEMVSNNAKS